MDGRSKNFVIYQKEFVRLVESSASNGPAGEDASYSQGLSLEGMVPHHASEPDHISNTSHSFLPTGMPNSCCNVIHVPIPTRRETWGEGTESGEASGGVGHGEGVEENGLRVCANDGDEGDMNMFIEKMGFIVSDTDGNKVKL